MRLLTRKELSNHLSLAYGTRFYSETLGEALLRGAQATADGNFKALLNHTVLECGIWLLDWVDDIAVIQFCIDNFVEEF